MIAAPPTITVPTPAAAPSATLMIYTPGPILCAGRPIAEIVPVRTRPALAVRYGTLPSITAEVRFSFVITADGRAGTIRRTAVRGYGGEIDDLAPALAAARFAESPQQDCTIAFVPHATPVATAPLKPLYEIASQPGRTAPPEELLTRIRPADADCAHGPDGFRQLNNPAFEKIAVAPGTLDWSFLTYDVDRAGTTRNVTLHASSGNAALDRASVRALAHNRYAPGPGHRGCVYHFHRSGRAAAPPPDLPPGTPIDTGDLAACRIDPKTVARLFQANTYPAAFLRRKIEGVVAVRYDTAPWGAIGNVKVIASEPDEAFGEAVRTTLYGASVAENEVGHRDCVRRIRFTLPMDAPG